MVKQPRQTTGTAQDAKTVLPGLPTPATTESPQRPFSGDLDTIAELRTEWDRKKKELLDQKTQLDERAAVLDARAADLDARKLQLDARETELQATHAGMPSWEDLDAHNMTLFFRDENGVIARNTYTDVDHLIAEMKVFRRDVHMEAARAAGLEVYTEAPADAL